MTGSSEGCENGGAPRQGRQSRRGDARRALAAKRNYNSWGTVRLQPGALAADDAAASSQQTVRRRSLCRLLSIEARPCLAAKHSYGVDSSGRACWIAVSASPRAGSKFSTHRKGSLFGRRPLCRRLSVEARPGLAAKHLYAVDLSGRQRRITVALVDSSPRQSHSGAEDAEIASDTVNRGGPAEECSVDVADISEQVQLTTLGQGDRRFRRMSAVARLNVASQHAYPLTPAGQPRRMSLLGQGKAIRRASLDATRQLSEQHAYLTDRPSATCSPNRSARRSSLPWETADWSTDARRILASRRSFLHVDDMHVSSKADDSAAGQGPADPYVGNWLSYDLMGDPHSVLADLDISLLERIGSMAQNWGATSLRCVVSQENGQVSLDVRGGPLDLSQTFSVGDGAQTTSGPLGKAVVTPVWVEGPPTMLVIEECCEGLQAFRIRLLLQTEDEMHLLLTSSSGSSATWMLRRQS
eukprot:TRINITY_DN16931_c0_g1_i1.p1 TRINITY_DN16931_c0_g1~~TRINITY_DN16931_c0_g1_i1.p1  ORF type:complete len:469 (-),score=36.03 TRINITY_DN16931_c0_g1_i1:45-1451(-)